MERKVFFLLVVVSICVVACSSKSQQSELEAMDYQLIFRDDAGRELTLADIKKVNGDVSYQIVTEASVPLDAKRLHAQGRELGSQGKYDQALEVFEKAHQLAPDWPYPLYDAAFTYLLKGDNKKALEYYIAVNEIAPRGFFTVKPAVDTLEREQAGIVNEGTYGLLVQLEWMKDLDAKKRILTQILEETPQLPLAWKELAVLLEDDEASLEAIDKGLSYQPDLETKGVLLVNKALILYRQGNENEAIAMLGELALDPESTVQTEHMAKATLASLLLDK